MWEEPKQKPGTGHQSSAACPQSGVSHWSNIGPSPLCPFLCGLFKTQQHLGAREGTTRERRGGPQVYEGMGIFSKNFGSSQKVT